MVSKQLPFISMSPAYRITEQGPVVLLSHIPLHRPDTATCGRLREKGTIRRGVGHGYQNTLGKETTYYLLDTLHPIAVFRFVLDTSSCVAYSSSAQR